MKLFDLFTEHMTPDWDVFAKTFPEMLTCNHSMRWHKEGSPFYHTKLVTREMYNKLTKDEEYETGSEGYLVMMSAAMLHDIGKPSTTYWDKEKEDWCCKSHGEAGEKLFRELFIDERIDLREKVAYMIRNHMALHYLCDKNEDTKEKIIIDLSNGTVSFHDMLLLNECDMRGSINCKNDDASVQSHIDKVMDEVRSVIRKKNLYPWTYVKACTRKAYVMIGLPGSGKTTYAKTIQDDYLERGIHIPIISRDTIRAELGYCKDGEKFLGSKEQEKEVTRVFDEKIRSQVGDFIIDNTSLKRKYRKDYCDYARNYDIAPIFIYVEAPSLNDNIARRYGQIDENVIKRMWNDMDFPSKSECYQLWLYSQRDDKMYELL